MILAVDNRIAMAILLVLTLSALVAGDPIFVENFDSFNRNNWYVEVVSNPHNNELQYYTDRNENVRAEGGKLILTPLKENYGGRQYTSGRIKSKFAWKYGRVEVRAKLPNGFGLWPAIWMMPRDSVYGGWPQSGEIDIMEARGQNNHEFASTIHYGICCDNHYWESSGDRTTQCNNDQYHVYTLDWTPTKLVYRLDGKAHHEHNLDRTISWMYNQKGQPFDQYFFMILNVAIGGDYLEDPKPDTVWNYPDAEMWVDYMKVYPLEDIATYSCKVKDDADPQEVCSNVEWACYNQNYADVSAQCTPELHACCAAPYACDSNTLHTLASAVFASYDTIVNDANSCHFSGTAEKNYVLHDGDLGDIGSSQCLIRDGASAEEICGAMKWTCHEQSYADVSSECGAGGDVLDCCYADPYSCDYHRLGDAAQKVFQAYYDALPQPSSCDFGGLCYLKNSLVPLECTDGYGG